jgi:hypothetical protein
MSESTSSTPIMNGGGKKDPFKISFIIGIVGIAIAGYGVYKGYDGGDSRPLFSWLIGLGFWMSVCIGMLFLILLSHIFKAQWSIILRRQMEHCMMAFPVLGILFLPLISIVHLDDPMHPEASEHHTSIQQEVNEARQELFAQYEGVQGDEGKKGEHADHHDGHHDDHGHGGLKLKRGLLWKWMALDGTEHHDVLLSAKESFLNREAFTLRFFLYFAVFCGLGMFFRNASTRQDKDGDIKWTHRSLKVAAVGTLAVALSTTFAAIDWFKAIEHHWFSTMYGVWYFACSMRLGLAFTVVICFILSTRGELKGIYKQAHRYDLGCLMLAFTIFWAYISFSQFFLIYNANIPEETFWYNIRQFNPANPDQPNSWYAIGMCLIFCNFFFPFFFLLFYYSKVTHRKILFISCWIIFWQLIDIFYNILPGIIPEANPAIGAFDYTVRQFSVTAYDFAAVIGIGALCVTAYLWSRARTEPIPIRDPRILLSINHHE